MTRADAARRPAVSAGACIMGGSGGFSWSAADDLDLGIQGSNSAYCLGHTAHPLTKLGNCPTGCSQTMKGGGVCRCVGAEIPPPVQLPPPHASAHPARLRCHARPGPSWCPSVIPPPYGSSKGGYQWHVRLDPPRTRKSKGRQCHLQESAMAGKFTEGSNHKVVRGYGCPI